VLNLAQVGRFRVAIEERPRRLAGIVTGLGEGLPHETIVGAVLRAMIRASGPPVQAGFWALPSLLLHTKRYLLDRRGSGQGKSGATHCCKEKDAPVKADPRNLFHLALGANLASSGETLDLVGRA
jgi:hypothetical protein